MMMMCCVLSLLCVLMKILWSGIYDAYTCHTCQLLS